MAYVRKTQTLINDVVENIDTMRGKELERYPVSRTMVEDSERSCVERQFWKEAPDLFGTLPAKWCEDSDVVKLRVLTSDGQHTIEFSAQSGKKFLLPPDMRVWNPTTECALSDLDVPSLNARVCDVIVNKDKRKEITDRFSEIRNQLRTLLEQHSSLNTALKTLPELALYVPPRYIDKVNEKEVRQRNTATSTTNPVEELEIDVDALVATAIASRMK